MATSQPTCATCRHRGSAQPNVTGGVECRRYPPAMVDWQVKFATTIDEVTCGEWAAKADPAPVNDDTADRIIDMLAKKGRPVLRQEIERAFGLPWQIGWRSKATAEKCIALSEALSVLLACGRITSAATGEGHVAYSLTPAVEAKPVGLISPDAVATVIANALAKGELRTTGSDGDRLAARIVCGIADGSLRR